MKNEEIEKFNSALKSFAVWNCEPISIEHDIIEQYIVSHIEMCLDAIAC